MITYYAQAAFSSLKIRNYRIYFFSQCISLSGTWMQTVALGWLVLEVTGSGTQLGLVTALQFLPLLLFGPWGGVIVDKFSTKQVLFWTQFVLGLLSLALALMIVGAFLKLWIIYLFATAVGFANLFDKPGRHAFISEIVDNSELKNAVSLNATANNLARIVGPLVAGILIATIGTALCFVVNAFSFFIVMFTLQRMDDDAINTPERHETGGGVLAGITYIRENIVVREMLIMAAVIGTFAIEWQVSLPLFAKETFQGDAQTYALLMSSLGGGAVIGGFYAAMQKKARKSRLLFFAYLFGFSMVVAALMPNLYLACAALMFVGFFMINCNTTANAIIQLSTRPDMRGRVMAFWAMAIAGSTPIGGPIIGAIGEYLGARMGLGLGGIAVILGTLYASRKLAGIATSDAINTARTEK